MKERLVPYLACPDCGGDFTLGRTQRQGAEILDGDLTCGGCRRVYPILRGVPRLLPTGLEHIATEVADGFGWQWNRFDEIGKPEYEQQLRDWLHPLGPEDFAGKKVIEGGCGKGRHSSIVAQWGAAEVFCVDLGPAVEAAYRNTNHIDAVHVIQGDVTRLPLKPVAEVAFSVGVLHHLPVPRDGFRSLADHVVPGGRLAVWVYGAEGNEWITRFVDPVRTRVTAKMDRELLYKLTVPLGLLVSGVAKGVYGPAARLAPSLHARLFYREYMTYIAQLTTRDIHNIVFDQLVTAGGVLPAQGRGGVVVRRAALLRAPDRAAQRQLVARQRARAGEGAIMSRAMKETAPRRRFPTVIAGVVLLSLGAAVAGKAPATQDPGKEKAAKMQSEITAALVKKARRGAARAHPAWRGPGGVAVARLRRRRARLLRRELPRRRRGPRTRCSGASSWRSNRWTATSSRSAASCADPPTSTPGRCCPSTRCSPRSIPRRT